MKKKRFLSLLMAFAVICSLVGCQTDEGSVESSITSEIVTENIQNQEVEFKTIKPPKDGWTLKELSQVIYINEKPISLPLTIDELKDILGDEFDVNVEDYIVMNNDKDVFSISSQDNVNISTLYFSEAFNRSSYSDEKLICINGLRIGDDEEKLINRMGVPDNITGDNALLYKYNLNKTDNIFIAIRCENSKIIRIIFNLEEKNE